MVFVPYSLHSTVIEAVFVEASAMTAHVAGTWYPAQPKELTDMLRSLNAKAAQKFAVDVHGGLPCALIVPHAGYQYSGAIAAAAYRLAQSMTIDRVIILGPSHFALFHGVALPPLPL